MLPKINMRDGCIWVETDLNYFQIMNTLDAILAMRECPVKGLVWLLSSKPISIKFDEIDKLTAISRKLFKRIGAHCKIAIVTASAFHSSIIACFHQVASDLPFPLKTFSEPELAVEWINSD